MRAQPATLGRGEREGGETTQTSPLRKVYWTAAAALAALVPMILGAGLWVRAELNQSKRDLQRFQIIALPGLEEDVSRLLSRNVVPTTRTNRGSLISNLCPIEGAFVRAQ